MIFSTSPLRQRLHLVRLGVLEQSGLVDAHREKFFSDMNTCAYTLVAYADRNMPMKLTINDRIYPDPSKAVLLAAIAKCNDVAILERDDFFVQCRLAAEDSFELELVDGENRQHFSPVKGNLTRDEVSDLFVKFYATVEGWQTWIEWRLADYQPSPEDILASSPSYEAPHLAALKVELHRVRDDTRRLNEEAQRVAEEEAVRLELERMEQVFRESAGDVCTTAAQTGAATDGYSPSWSAVGAHGQVNGQLICPHCAKKGMVHMRQVSKKFGISGGKATAGLLTGGLSLLLTGLARRDKVNEAYCANCSTTWHF